MAGLAAALTLLGIVVGLPLALLAAGQLPHSVPSLDQVRDDLFGRDDGTLVLTILTVIGWAAWAYLTVAIVLEVASRLRGVTAPHLPGFHLPQNTARGLVSTALLLFVAIPTAAPDANATIPHAPTLTTAATTALTTARTSAPNGPAQARTPSAANHNVKPSTLRPAADAKRGTAQATAAPTAPQTLVRHTVRHGESLWSIAERYLGDGRQFPQIADANADVLGRNPGFLRTGTVLKIPTAQAAAPTVTLAHRLTVEKGDTLSQIALEELGNAGRYPEIFNASRGITQPDGAHLRDPNLIYVGWALNIPQPATTASAGTPAPHQAAHVHPKPPKQNPPPHPNEAAPRARAGAVGAPTKVAPPNQAPASGRVGAGEWWRITDGRVSAATAPKTAPSAPTAPAGKSLTPPAETPRATTSETATAPKTIFAAPWVLTGLTGGGGFLAGSMMLVLRRRRRAQFRARRPGRTIATPQPRLAPVEKTITVIGSAAIPDVERLDQVLCRLAAARTGCQLVMPEVAAVQLTRHTLTLHLSNPMTLPQPWNGSADAMHWVVYTTTDTVEQIGPLVPDQPAPYPLLVTIGHGTAGDTWLLNVEDLTLNITGDLDYSRDFARYLVAEIACNPWSHGVRAELVGVATEVAAMNPDRVRVHDDGDAAAEVLAAAVAMIDRAQDAGIDVTNARATQAGADTWPARLIILDAATKQTHSLSRLLELVHTHPGLTGTSIVVRGESTNELGITLHVSSNGRVTMPASGLDLVAVGLTSDEAQGCAALLTQSDDLHDIEIPSDEDADGWRAWANEAGALRPEHTIPRDSNTGQEEGLTTTVLEAQDEEYVHSGATTRQDLQALAPKITAQVSAAVLHADPELDNDVAAWWASDCPLPRLSLLGPVGAITRGTPVTKRKPYFTEVLAFLSTRAHGATPEELAEAFGISPGKARDYANIVRSWLGTNPRTGDDHLPDARKAPAARNRGVAVYEILDLLKDVDLFRRLRARGEAQGAHGIDDLDSALRLVQGRPFDRLRPGGWSWLADGDRLDHHMICAIVDVAHLVTTYSLQTGDLRRARLAAETAALAAPDEEIPRLDLAAIANAEGHTGEAQRLLRDEVYNRSDDDDAPTELSERTQQIIAGKNWTDAKGTRQAS
ncbi:hypothetical protein BA895_10985 [Humibacillus sp. DSM 29435]|nr:hypothetical protein BA895_10985 [Humibacillus sp. DSM 29435]